MNALAHYALLLSRSDNASITNAEAESQSLREEARGLYERLQFVDADRQERYKDMGESRHSFSFCNVNVGQGDNGD